MRIRITFFICLLFCITVHAQKENFGELNNWLTNTGVGYRLELQPRMNLRIDFGVGKNSSGLYFNMTEAF